MHKQQQRTSASPEPAGSRRAPVGPAPLPAPARAVPAGRPQASPDALAGILARTVSQRTLARKKTIKNGTATFVIDPYKMHLPDEDGDDTDRQVGVDVGVTYVPAKNVTSDKIAFVQTIKATKGGAAYLFDNMKARATDDTSDEAGWAVDRVAGRKSPIYGQDNDDSASGTVTFGHRKTRKWWSDKVQNAMMRDYVKLNRVKGQAVTTDAVSWAFDETNGTYLGGVSWGFSTDSTGTTSLMAPALESAGAPTGVHKTALQNWNAQADLQDVSQRNSPDQAKIVVP